MTFSILAVIAGSLLLLAGFIGCLVPVLPGPPVAFIALLAVSAAGSFELYSPALLVVLAVAAAAAALLDSILPVYSSRAAGAGTAGIRGSIVGLIVGTIFFPPFGTILGTFLGALAGELIWRREDSRPLKAALGVFTGTLAAIVLKLAVSGVIAFYFVKGAAGLFS